MRYMTEKNKVTQREETLDYAYINDTQVELDDGRVTRTTFIRIVRPETVDAKEIHTYSAEDVMVDLDGDGNIIGVTVFTL